MAGAPHTNTTAPAGDLPDEIYIAFVDGLVTDVVPVLLLTAVAVTCGEIAAAIAAGQSALLYGAASQPLIAGARLYFAQRHAKSLPSPTVEVAANTNKRTLAGRSRAWAGFRYGPCSRSASLTTASHNLSASQ
jgi:hypothetical protein